MPLLSKELSGAGRLTYRSAVRGYRQRSRTGYTLLMTLLALMILVTVVGHFISENTLHVRASSHRIENTQTQYAAESGVIFGTQMLTDALRRNALLSKAAAQSEQQGADPNDAVPIESLEEPSFVIERREIQIGGVDVTIEIQDENAKWPMLWLVRSPIGQGGEANRRARKSVLQLCQELDFDSEEFTEAIDEATTILARMDLPPTQKVVDLPSRTRRGRSRTRHIGYKAKLAEKEDTHAEMGSFARQWSQEVLQGPEARSLRADLPGYPSSIAEQLGTWGNSYLNINTASAEVLQSALADYGMTMSLARSLVQSRSEQPFSSISNVVATVKLDEDLVKAITGLCDVKSNVFSLHINAQLGRTSYKLVSGMFKDHRGYVKRLAVFPGE